MNSIEVLILSACYKHLQNGNSSINGDFLIEQLKLVCTESELEILRSIDLLWEDNYLESSNGFYYLTDKSLKFFKKLGNGSISNQ